MKTALLLFKELNKFEDSHLRGRGDYYVLLCTVSYGCTFKLCIILISWAIEFKLIKSLVYRRTWGQLCKPDFWDQSRKLKWKKNQWTVYEILRKIIKNNFNILLATQIYVIYTSITFTQCIIGIRVEIYLEVGN